MYLKTKLTVALIISLPVMVSYAAKDDSGDKIDLTAIEARLTELEAAVLALETVSYEGNYAFTVTGSRTKDCQNAGMLDYDASNYEPFSYDQFVGAQIFSEEISSITSQNHLGNHFGVATSADNILIIPSHQLFGHSINMTGEANLY